jgi:hypothetical protein
MELPTSQEGETAKKGCAVGHARHREGMDCKRYSSETILEEDECTNGKLPWIQSSSTLMPSCDLVLCPRVCVPALIRTRALRGRQKGVAPVMWTNIVYASGGYVLCELAALGFVTRPHCSAVAGEVERLLRLHGPKRSVCVLYRHCQGRPREKGGMGTRESKQGTTPPVKPAKTIKVQVTVIELTQPSFITIPKAGKAHNTSPVC